MAFPSLLSLPIFTDFFGQTDQKSVWNLVTTRSMNTSKNPSLPFYHVKYCMITSLGVPERLEYVIRFVFALLFVL